MISYRSGVGDLFQIIAKLSPSSNASWAELVIISINPATHPPNTPESLYKYDRAICPKPMKFVYVSRVYSMVQNNPRPQDDLTEAVNVRNNVNRNS